MRGAFVALTGAQHRDISASLVLATANLSICPTSAQSHSGCGRPVQLQLAVLSPYSEVWLNADIQRAVHEHVHQTPDVPNTSQLSPGDGGRTLTATVPREQCRMLRRVG